MTQWQWLLRKIVKRVWFRGAMIALLSVVLALGSTWLAPLIPYELNVKLGADAVDNILTIIASSMLAVTTFSMAAMVSAFNSAAANVTPRASQLLIEDRVAQNALSTFIGGFIFGIVGIIALSSGFYGPEARVVLFFGTILMIVVIVATLFRWIQQLTGFGRMSDAVDRVEAATIGALGRYPGPLQSTGAGRWPDESGQCVRSERTGYVTHYDREAIRDLCKARGARFRIAASPGAFVDGRCALGWADRPLSDEAEEALRNAFSISAHRDFTHDPRFGAVVLAEIASRALSPAVNDPGSAISVLGAGQRVLEAHLRKGSAPCRDEVTDPPLSFEDMAQDLISPIARDGAGLFEVGIRLQSMLGSLAGQAPAARPMLARIASDAIDRARRSGIAAGDLERIEIARHRAFAPLS